jgi:hypothetical protein
LKLLRYLAQTLTRRGPDPTDEAIELADRALHAQPRMPAVLTVKGCRLRPIKAIPLRPLFAAIYAALTAFQVFRPAAMNQIKHQRYAYFRI